MHADDESCCKKLSSCFCVVQTSQLIMIFRVSAVARARAGVIGRRYASSEVATQTGSGLNAFAAAWYNMYVFPT